VTIQLTEALDSDNSIVLTVKRKLSGARVDGVWIPGSDTILKIFASPQPASPDELQNLPEGERDKSIFKFISNKPLFTTQDRNGTDADLVMFKGNDYRVISVGDWDTFGYTLAFSAKV
jgi:hypothetical protein